MRRSIKGIKLIFSLLLSTTLLCNCGNKKIEYLEAWSSMTEYNEVGAKVSDATQTFNKLDQLSERKKNFYDVTSGKEIKNEQTLYTYNPKGDVLTIITKVTSLNAITTSTTDTYSYKYRANKTIEEKEVKEKIDDGKEKIRYHAKYDKLERIVYEIDYFYSDNTQFIGEYNYSDNFINYTDATLTYKYQPVNNQKEDDLTIIISNKLDTKGNVVEQKMQFSSGKTIKSFYTIDKHNCPIVIESYISGLAVEEGYVYAENVYYKNNPNKLESSIFVYYLSQILNNIGALVNEYDDYGRTIKVTTVGDKDIEGVTVYEYDRLTPAK